MMENCSQALKSDDQMNLPPGFRFHPTDEELITHYLSKKVLDVRFACVAIGEVDMNKVEPWELPWKAKLGEKEWYFFCVRDKKYPTGLRTNRATAAGYWKATGKDKEIFRGKTLVGMKKTLVFYRGRAPKGIKSNWVTHEYRLEGKFSLDNLPAPVKNDWVISRVFQKTTGGKKVHISGLVRMNPMDHNDMSPSSLPALMDPSPYISAQIKQDEAESSRVSCFSTSPVVAAAASHQKMQENMIPPLNSQVFAQSSSAIDYFSAGSWGQFQGFQYASASNPVQDPSFRALLGNNGYRKEEDMASVSQETAMSNENSSAMSNLDMGKKQFEGQDLACMWTY